MNAARVRKSDRSDGDEIVTYGDGAEEDGRGKLKGRSGGDGAIVGDRQRRVS